MAAAREIVMTEAASGTCEGCGNFTAPGSRFCPACGREFSAVRIGEVLDSRYEILEKVAEGGMGEVFRARHLHLDEIRIIKVMKPMGAGDGTQDRRFSEEARLATRIRHPNVAALYDLSKLPSGGSYMVWELIDGTTLLQRLRRIGPLSPEEAVDIGTQVLSGLGEIHRAGVVHRDISPDNIMIVDRGSRRAVKIIDLGIAKKVAEDRLGMTATGMFLGKLKYCSPEQAGSLPAGEALDGRSDLYSFGAVLYEMLSGKPLFESPTPEGYIAKHLQEAPPLLRRDDLPEDVVSGFRAVISRALQKDRSRRYASAEEFAAALSSLGGRTLASPAAMTTKASEDETHRISTTTSGATVIEAHSPAVRAAIRAVIRFSIVVGILAAAFAWRKAAERTSARPSEARVAAAALPPHAIPAPPPVPATAPPAPSPKIIESPVTPPTPPKRPRPRTAPPPAPEEIRARPREPAGAEKESAIAPPAPDESAAIEKLGRLRRAAAGGGPRDVDAFVEFVDDYVLRNPGTPFAGVLKASLPTELKTQAKNAEAAGHPWRAFRLYRIYTRLPFAPPDAEVESRVKDLEARLPARVRER